MFFHPITHYLPVGQKSTKKYVFYINTCYILTCFLQICNIKIAIKTKINILFWFIILKTSVRNIRNEISKKTFPLLSAIFIKNVP